MLKGQDLEKEIKEFKGKTKEYLITCYTYNLLNYT